MDTEPSRTRAREIFEHGWVVCLSGMRLGSRSSRSCTRPPGALRVLPPAARGSLSAPSGRGHSWKRRSFTRRPKWVRWAWIGLERCCWWLILAAGAFKFLRRKYDSIQDRSIQQLLDSSQHHEAEGRLGEALIDLDAALDLAEKAGPDWSSAHWPISGPGGPISRDAMRDAVLEALDESQSPTLPTGQTGST